MIYTEGGPITGQDRQGTIPNVKVLLNYMANNNKILRISFYIYTFDKQLKTKHYVRISKIHQRVQR